MKPILYSLAACLAMSASAQDKPEIFKLYNDDGETLMINALSDNGKYATSQSMGDQNADNPHGDGGYIVELDTRKVTKITTPSGWGDINDVADNGVVVGAYDGIPAYWTPDTDTWTSLPVPSGRGGGALIAVTPDAKYAVGYCNDPVDIFFAMPVLYDLVSGVVIDTPNLPTVDLAGLDQHQNLFYGISPDGRYILGQMSQSYLMPVSLFSYVYVTDSNTWSPIGYSYNASTQKYTCLVDNLHFIDNQHFSCDGNWVTGTAYMVYNDGQSMGGTEFFSPYRYNLSTNAVEIYGADGDQGIGGDKITADGVVLGHAPYGNPYPTAMVRSGKYFIGLDQILSQVYNTTLYAHVQDNVTGAFQAISADGLTAVMVSYDNCYVIRMPESFESAASKIDLLATYTLSIPQGSSLSSINELKITFDRAVGIYNQASRIKLLDGNGQEVRSASGFSVAADNDHQVVIAFRTTALNDGEEYSVVIPAGMVWISDDTAITNQEITVTYVGRSADPVALTSVSPAPASAVAQLNSYPDVVNITFDTPIAVSSSARAWLYNDDTDEIVAPMLMSAQDNVLSVYPTSTYMLYKGSNYRVNIEAGAITDLTGNNPNEEINITYVGAYVRTLSTDDIYIFNSACDDYEYFMMWKGQWHQPAAIPASWNFTEDSAWLLVRSSDETTDQALASHSMYTEPAQSDDWFITPQLYIPDSRVHLAFDAQSYLTNKQDTLRVYVYACDEVYNYIYNDQAEAIRNDGDLVLCQVLTPGASQEGLEGDWTRYTVDLADYAGKNIYIAFVNHNFDQSAIFINDVQVIRDMSFLVTMLTPKAVVDQDEVAVKGILSVGSEIADYQGVEMTLHDSEGNVVASIHDAAASLKYGDAYNFEFDTPLPLMVGEENAYSIDVKSGSDAASYTFSIKDLTFLPAQKVVLEEYSGTDCSNCPLGIVAIENLKELYPDNFVPMLLRTYGSDPLGTGLGNYTAFLGFNAAPSARINRGPILMPTFQSANGFTFSGKGLVDEDGQDVVLWADAVQQALDAPAEAEVTLAPTYDSNTGDITVPCQVRFALNSDSRSISLMAVVLEDGLSTRQLNGYAAFDDPLLGEWGAGGMYGSQVVRNWKIDDVVRHVVNGDAYNGEKLAESNFVAGESYEITLASQIETDLLENLDNCKVVALLIDGGTQRVINAEVAKFEMSGISDIVGDSKAPLYYNLQGMPIDNPRPGQVYVKVQNGKSTKVIIK